jgi:hypothetical protein
MSRRIALSMAAYVVPTFLLGFAWHLVLFADYYQGLRIYRPDVIIPFGFASMLLQGAIFAWAYPRLVEQPEQVSSGLKFAAVAALLSWSFTTLAVAAKHPMTSIGGFVAIETGYTALQFLLVGPLLALASRGRLADAASGTNVRGGVLSGRD